MDHLPDSLLVALGKAPIRQVLHGVETATLVLPEHGEVEIAWERYATHSRCVFATEEDAIRFALGVGHPYLDLRDALALMLTNHAFSQLPRGKAITERTIINAFFRAMAPFVYRARREMHEAGLTPSTSPPYVPNIDTDRPQQEAALAWANYVRERLTKWWSEIHPLFVAAEVGDPPQDERLRGRLMGIARVKRLIDPVPADTKADLSNVVQRVARERKRRGRPVGNLDAADLAPEEWGSREHHRAATDRGYARDRKTLKRRMTRILDRLRRPA
jgi:hypothetical protein